MRGVSCGLSFIISLLICAISPVISIDADQVRAHCINAFELAFPKQQWTTENDLRAFADNVSTEHKADTFWACPLGGGPGSEMNDFTGGELLDWFLKMFNPNALQYSEIITSEVSVVGNVCSMDKLFFSTMGKCHVHAMSRLMIEVDDDGKLVRWLDHFDQDDLNQKMGVCNLRLDGNDEF